MEAMLEFLVVLPSAVMVAVGVVRAAWTTPAEWRAAAAAHAAPASPARRRLVLVHDSAREKLLRSGGARANRAGGRLRLVYNGG